MKNKNMFLVFEKVIQYILKSITYLTWYKRYHALFQAT